ncbi:glycosyltransferase family 39 protein [Streptomyces parvus]|uniref:glycosyltransferase family 39 protein n=1 Tax=Streptomyces parvus TaxID=66428 RepID=UPI002100C186|nr:glycosyltransferase family 39 protein [Streptomyces parvus]MCQ1581890.1 glycosyltransferase family 39 protein [Streptomyces parvus]
MRTPIASSVTGVDIVTAPATTPVPAAPRDSPATHRPSSSRRSVACALAPAATALALGLWGIRREGSLWSDEAVTYEVAHRSASDIWRLLAEADVVHGLHYFFMHAVFACWEGGSVALRLPSVLAVASTAAGVGLLGRRLAGTRAGLLAGLVLPLLPTMQRYAQEGRSYALVCALMTWGTWLLLNALDVGGRKHWTGYGAVMLAAGLLHELALLGLMAHGITVALSRERLRPWAVTAAAVTAGLAPIALFSATQSGQVAWIGAPDASDLLAFAGTALLGTVCARLCRARNSAPAAVGVPALALPLLLLPAGLLLALSPLRPLYVDRYVLFGSIGLALLVGAALARCRRGTTAIASLMLAATVLLPFSYDLRTPGSRSDDVTAVAEAVQKMSASGDGLLFTPARRAWLLATPDAYAHLDDLALASSPAASGTLFGTEVTPAEIHARMLTFQRIVAVQDAVGEPGDSTGRGATKVATLQAHFEVCATRRVTRAQITVYARPGLC